MVEEFEQAPIDAIKSNVAGLQDHGGFDNDDVNPSAWDGSKASTEHDSAFFEVGILRHSIV